MYSNQWCHSKSIKLQEVSQNCCDHPGLAHLFCRKLQRLDVNHKCTWEASIDPGLLASVSRTGPGRGTRKLHPKKHRFVLDDQPICGLEVFEHWSKRAVEVLNSNDFQQRPSSVSYDPKLDNLMTQILHKRCVWNGACPALVGTNICFFWHFQLVFVTNTLGDVAIK